MKITDVTTHVMGVPGPGGHSPSRNWIFVRIDTDEHLIGVGEATTEYHEQAVAAMIECHEDSARGVSRQRANRFAVRYGVPNVNQIVIGGRRQEPALRVPGEPKRPGGDLVKAQRLKLFSLIQIKEADRVTARSRQAAVARMVRQASGDLAD